MTAPQSFVAELSLPPRELSPNLYLRSWAAKARATKAYREACAWIFLHAKPKNWRMAPIVIEVEYRCSRGAKGYRPADIQNAISSLKSACDSLQDASVIPNDSKAWLTWGEFTLITRKCDEGDGVTVTVRQA
jgi:Holliday junction resolvase RusA-like endonuclease